MAEKRATSFDVAKLAGVSRTTVSFVLNNVPDVRISTATCEKVLDAAHALNYHPNASGRKLSSGKSSVIGLVLLQSTEQLFNDAFLLQVLMGIEDAAARHGYQVLLKHIKDNNFEGYSQLVNENHADGIIFSGPLLHDPDLVNLYRKGYPIMLMGQMTDTEIPFVDVNAELGAQIAVEHLIKNGHQRIAMITNAKFKYSSAQQRTNGFLNALRAANILIDDKLIKEGDFTPSSGFVAMNSLLDVRPRPTAVFIASDVVAIGAIQAIRQRRLKIPGDIAVMGFDDIPMAQYVDPPLSTVRLPAYGIGWAAGERLIRLILGEKLDVHGVLLDTELIVRNTT